MRFTVVIFLILAGAVSAGAIFLATANIAPSRGLAEIELPNIKPQQ